MDINQRASKRSAQIKIQWKIGRYFVFIVILWYFNGWCCLLIFEMHLLPFWTIEPHLKYYTVFCFFRYGMSLLIGTRPEMEHFSFKFFGMISEGRGMGGGRWAPLENHNNWCSNGAPISFKGLYWLLWRALYSKVAHRSDKKSSWKKKQATSKLNDVLCKTQETLCHFIKRT